MNDVSKESGMTLGGAEEDFIHWYENEHFDLYEGVRKDFCRQAWNAAIDAHMAKAGVPTAWLCVTPGEIWADVHKPEDESIIVSPLYAAPQSAKPAGRADSVIGELEGSLLNQIRIITQQRDEARAALAKPAQVEAVDDYTEGFAEWINSAYSFEGDGSFTRFNMEVAYAAGRERAALAHPRPSYPEIPDGSMGARARPMDGDYAKKIRGSIIRRLEGFHESNPTGWCGYLDDALGAAEVIAEEMERAAPTGGDHHRAWQAGEVGGWTSVDELVSDICELPVADPGHPDTVCVNVKSLRAEIESALSQPQPVGAPDDVAKDAARYQWLKSCNGGHIGIYAFHRDPEQEVVLVETRADQAIDEAMLAATSAPCKGGEA